MPNSPEHVGSYGLDLAEYGFLLSVMESILWVALIVLLLLIGLLFSGYVSAWREYRRQIRRPERHHDPAVCESDAVPGATAQSSVL